MAGSEAGPGHTTVRVDRFEPDVFRQLMEFAHTGTVDLQPRTITGIICAADYYQFTDLRDGGLQFFPMCLKVRVGRVKGNSVMTQFSD